MPDRHRPPASRRPDLRRRLQKRTLAARAQSALLGTLTVHLRKLESRAQKRASWQPIRSKSADKALEPHRNQMGRE